MQFLNRKPQHSIVVRIVFFLFCLPVLVLGWFFSSAHDFPFIVSCRGVLTMFYLFCCAFFCCCFAVRKYIWKPLKTRVCLTKLDFRQKWVCDFMVFSPSTTRSMPCHDCAHLISNQFSILAFNYEIQITTQSRRCGPWLAATCGGAGLLRWGGKLRGRSRQQIILKFIYHSFPFFKCTQRGDSQMNVSV